MHTQAYHIFRPSDHTQNSQAPSRLSVVHVLWCVWWRYRASLCAPSGRSSPSLLGSTWFAPQSTAHPVPCRGTAHTHFRPQQRLTHPLGNPEHDCARLANPTIASLRQHKVEALAAMPRPHLSSAVLGTGTPLKRDISAEPALSSPITSLARHKASVVA